ncbi:mechanosensitive ion channel family protein [Candidatus Woesearchaeota archaeon]|nr:mechanosensitive ion channel family protein [Candidatus Woesearchaeota archaeon]
MALEFTLPYTKEELIAIGQVALEKAIWLVLILAVGWIVIKIITKIVSKFFDKVDFDRAAETFVENTIKVVLWAVLAILVLANMGLDVSALIAGLGIMGFVVGFALKDTLGNLAAGVFILFHKPFRVGDWINIDGTVGGVETVGVAACELKSPDGIKITIPNSKIWSGTILNYHGNKVRKLFNLDIGISYSDDIGKAINIIQEILKKDKRILKDPAPQVVVKELSDSSVNIAVRPAMSKDDYWDVYFDTIRAIKEAFDKKGITIPFPQRTVWMKKPKRKK